MCDTFYVAEISKRDDGESKPAEVLQRDPEPELSDDTGDAERDEGIRAEDGF